jgi:phosphatidylglycerophosphate synthase
MRRLSLIGIVLFSLPQTVSAQGLFDIVPNFIIFLSSVIIPFLLGIAFLAFAYNVFRYLIAGGSNDESRGKGKAQIIWTLVAFILIYGEL